MNAGMKMLLVENARNGGGSGGNRGRQSGDRGGSGGRSEMEMRNEMRGGWDEMENGDGGMEMNEMESRRRRDSRGRFRSEMEMGGGYGEMEMRRGGPGSRSEMGYSEMRRGGSGGRSEMESRGGYGRSEMESMGGRSEMRGGESNMRSEMRGYPFRPFPVYEGGDRMNQIGFNAGEEFPSEYRMEATHNTGNEMEYMKGAKMGGYSSGTNRTLTKEMAEEWTGSMKNEDGTKGPHWTIDQAKQVMAQKGIEVDPVEFWAVLCMMYSDYCSVFKKHGVNKIDLYVDLACAWLNDKDSQKGKTARYFEEVVNH